jgi:hypothetical protein
MGWFAEMLGFRKVRKAQITPERRDIFERYGETVIQSVITGGFTPPSPTLQPIYSNIDRIRDDAESWLTERGDKAANKEHRLELVEWAILIFVIAGVIVDIGLARHWFDPSKKGVEKVPEISVLCGMVRLPFQLTCAGTVYSGGPLKRRSNSAGL